MKYECFLFDMDGTLADTSPGVFEGVRRTLRQMNEPPLPETELKKFIGPPLQASFREVCGLKPERVLEATERFRAYYREEGIFRNTLYPGMEELLRALKKEGKRLAVATLKLEPLARVLVRNAGISDCFDAVVGADPEGKRTKKDTIERAMALCGVADPSAVLMIGDSEFDWIGAVEAGVDFCAATYGFGLKPGVSDRHPCAAEIASPLELLEKLR